MIHLTHSVSGGEIGVALAEEPEELLEALEALAGRYGMFRDDVLDMIAGTRADNIARFCRDLADAIDNRQ